MLVPLTVLMITIVGCELTGQVSCGEGEVIW